MMHGRGWPVRGLVGGRVNVGVVAATGRGVILAPTLASVLPVSGSAAGGVALTLTGTNLGAATDVTVGGVACGAVTPTGPNTVTCTTPLTARGALDVVVTTPAGSATLAGGYTGTLVQTRAVDFDGVNDTCFDTVGTLPTTMTWGAWVKLDSGDTGAPYIWEIGTGSDLERIAVIYDTTAPDVRLAVQTGGGGYELVQTIEANPPTDAWAWFAFTRSGNTYYTWFGGTKSGPHTATGGPSVVGSVQLRFGEGYVGVGGSDNLAGRIARAIYAESVLADAVIEAYADSPQTALGAAPHEWLFGDVGRAYFSAGIDGAGAGTSTIYDAGTVGGYDLAAGAAQGFAVNSIVEDYPA